MHDDEAPTTTHNQRDSIQDIERLDVLGRRFGEAEIQRLSQLQLRQRERPDALDLPIEVHRLRFVRWLVECGRLGADDGSGFADSRWDEEPSPEQCACSHDSDSPNDQPLGEPSERKLRKDWRLSLRASWSRVCHEIARTLCIGCELGSDQSLPRAVDLWGQPGPYDPYCPCAGTPLYMEAPWYWIFLRRLY